MTVLALRIYFFFSLMCVKCGQGLPKDITIGGLFGEEEDERIQNVFKYAVYWVNHKPNYLPDTQLKFDTKILSSKDLFTSTKEVCAQINESSAAMFGPGSPELASFTSSLCRHVHLPHFEFYEEAALTSKEEYSIYLHPCPEKIAIATYDVISYHNMEEILILYGPKTGLTKMQYVIRKFSQQLGHVTRLRQIDSDESIRDALIEAKRKQWTNIIVDLDASKSSMFLRMALQQGMINPYYHYILTSLDLSALNLDDYKYNHVNITGFRLIDLENSFVKSIMKDMYWYQMNARLPLFSSENKNVIPYESALLFDAVLMFVKALQEFDKHHTLEASNVSCDSDLKWKSGRSLRNYVNTVQISGLTGQISLENGRRSSFEIDVVQLRKKGLEKIGHWTTSKRLRMNSNQTYELFANRTMVVTTNLTRPFIVSTLTEAPYVMIKDNADQDKLKGNSRYEGFCVDLMKEVAAYAGFEYEIHIVPDGLYGAYDKEKMEWNGIIRELMEKRADMSMAALTINYEREQFVDFTKPFLNLGISILFKSPKKEKPGLFSFLSPLAAEIWIYLLAAYITVSLGIFVLARLSPYEWYNPHPCNVDSDAVENTFNLGNSMWFAIGTLMQQGSDINPRACSTRLVGSTWWFFTLIMISSYTANLAAFLTIERMVSPIESVEDLEKQTEIKYGTRYNGTTMSFFKNSQFEIYQRMWNFMRMNEHSVMTKSGDEGIQKVKNGGYAFFMESTGIDYITKQDCSLMQVGGLLDSKGFGMATPVGSPLREKLSMAILHLQEGGRIEALYKKWWTGSANCEIEGSENAAGKSNPLGVDNVGGIFVVLLCGLAVSVVVAVIEFLYKSGKNANKDKVTLCTEIAKELRFAVKCGGGKVLTKSTDSVSGETILKSSLRDDGFDTFPNGGLPLRNMRRSPSNSRADLTHRYSLGYLPVHSSDGESV